jgi:hypothetical protein
MSDSLLFRICCCAVKALTYLAMQLLGRPSGTREIPERAHVPRPFIGDHRCDTGCVGAGTMDCQGLWQVPAWM